MRILVTGATGFIGGWVVRALAKQMPGASVIGVGRRPSPGRDLPAGMSDYIQCDLLDSSRLQQLLPERVDVVVHMAGDPRTRLLPEERIAQTHANVVGTAAIADYAVRAGARRLVYASSVYFYSGVSAPPFHEDRLDLPMENLGASKLAAEALLHARAMAGDFNVLSLRIFTVYGPGSRPEQFIPEAIRKLKAPDAAARFGAPGITRDFTYVGDVADAVVAATTASDRHVGFLAANVGTGVETSIRDVVLLLARLLRVERTIAFDESAAPTRVNVPRQSADLAESRRILGWQPLVPLHIGLQHTIDAMAASL